MGKFLDKSQLSLDRTTNATGLLSLFGAITGAIDGISHGRHVSAWLPMVAMGLAGAIAQWLQGVPTSQTRLIGEILQLDGSKTNAEFIRGIMARIIAAGVVPGLEPTVDRVDVGGTRSTARRGDAALNADTLDRIATESDVRDSAGSRPTVADPASVTADCWARKDGRRLPNVPQREFPSNLPEWLEFSQSDRIDTEF